ncbi:hypothetical protein WDU94_009901 [Cyamophila willieti]
MSSVHAKYWKGGALHRRGPPVFYSPTGDPTRDAWHGGGGAHFKKTTATPGTAKSKMVKQSRLSKSKLKLFYDIWKESQLDSSGNLPDPAEDGKDRDGENGEDTEREKEEKERKVPELQYSRAQLYDIQKLASSQVKPEFLDSFPIQARFSFVRGVWEQGGPGGPNPTSNQQGDRWPRAVTPNDGMYDGFNDNKVC